MSINSQIGTPPTTSADTELHAAADTAKQDPASQFHPPAPSEVPVAHIATVAVAVPPVVLAEPAAVPAPDAMAPAAPAVSADHRPGTGSARLPSTVQEDVKAKQVPAGGWIKPKSIATKVNGLSMLEGNVIPKRDASRIKGHYMTLSKALLRSTRFNPTEKLVIIYLTDMLMGDNDFCWSGLNTIAAETSLSRRTTITVLNKLADAGVIIKDPGGGRKHSTAYYLTQYLFPCQLHPETLCSRDTCQEQCPWMRANSADLAPFMPDSTENKQCEICTLSQINSADLAPFMPINSADLAPKEKNNNPNEKEGGGKRSCPPGAGDPEPRPPLSIEMPKVESGSEHRQVKSLFCRLYKEAFGNLYIWQARDGAILKGILQLDITLDKVKGAVRAMFQDEWLVDKGLVSMKTFKASINIYQAQASGQGPGDSSVIEVHAMPRAGEEPYQWRWDSTGELRIDYDIPKKCRNRAMNEFSASVVGKIETWFWNEDHNQGWPLTLIGKPGNCKTSLAATLLQQWRDHRTPGIGSDCFRPDLIAINGVSADSAFVTFEEFNAGSCFVERNEKTDYTGPSQINESYIDMLAQLKFLVLDDICSYEMKPTQYSALHNLLRRRELSGSVTIITTNRELGELSKLLGENVIDRLRSGLILKIMDESRRGQPHMPPQGAIQAEARGRVMPNPTGAPELANIPYVEPGAEEQAELAAAVASLESATASAGPVTANRGSLTPSMPAWGSGEEEQQHTVAVAE